MERLDKFLCDCGAGTRSQVKEIIKAGRVTVDGVTVRDPGFKVASRQVSVDGEQMGKTGRVVCMLNKPAGYVTATTDKRDKTVMELLPAQWKHLELKPVGRLDKETEGLLLFTNDGELLHRLISPKKEVEKVYYARHQGTAGQADVDAFREGLTLGDGTLCRPAKLVIAGEHESYITVQEGKYHQVRRMMAARGMPVQYLERRQEGTLTLGDLPRGQARLLTGEETAALLQETGLE